MYLIVIGGIYKRTRGGTDGNHLLHYKTFFSFALSHKIVLFFVHFSYVMQWLAKLFKPHYFFFPTFCVVAAFNYFKLLFTLI